MGEKELKKAILIGPCDPQASLELIKEWSHLPVFAADSGANVLCNNGIYPKAVIGDLDSLSSEARKKFAPVLKYVSEQETTDFHKALRHCPADVVIATGFLGGRIDHTLAVLTNMALLAHRKVILSDAENCLTLLPPRLALHLPMATPVSLYPLGEGGCASEGLKWPTNALKFSPLGRIGTSNQSLAPEVVLTPETPNFLGIFPRKFLAHVLLALEAAPSWLPAAHLPQDVHH